MKKLSQLSKPCLLKSRHYTRYLGGILAISGGRLRRGLEGGLGSKLIAGDWQGWRKTADETVSFFLFTNLFFRFLCLFSLCSMINEIYLAYLVVLLVCSIAKCRTLVYHRDFGCGIIRQ